MNTLKLSWTLVGVLSLFAVGCRNNPLDPSVTGSYFFGDIEIRVDENVGDDNNGGSTTTQFTITVSDSTTPTYSWTVGNAFSVTVARTSNRMMPVWGIVTPGLGNIESPVTHGAVPKGAIQTFATETTLTAGVKYTVSVARLDESIGFQDFTPTAN